MKFFVNTYKTMMSLTWHYYIYFKYIYIFLEKLKCHKILYQIVQKLDIVSSQRLTHNWLCFSCYKYEQEVVLLLYTLDSLFYSIVSFFRKWTFRCSSSRFRVAANTNEDTLFLLRMSNKPHTNLNDNLTHAHIRERIYIIH